MDDVIAEVVLACPAELLTETFEWFVDALGFRMEQIFPADAPRVAVVMGHGVRLARGGGGELERGNNACEEKQTDTEMNAAAARTAKQCRWPTRVCTLVELENPRCAV